jgi:hypothetical protein
MKTKYSKVNTCAACREKASNFIWASSRQVNKGIKVMYPKEKLCLKCYENMKTVYPEQPLTGKHQVCHCGGRIVEAKKGVGVVFLERYCEKCGVVVE